ncbi:MAG TPA: hypothetical protein VGM03_12415 [Phycisphaerae bacterium]|jgi:hypothetical protein
MGYDVFERCATTGAFRRIIQHSSPPAASAREIAARHMCAGHELVQSGADTHFAALREAASGLIVLIVVRRVPSAGAVPHTGRDARSFAASSLIPKHVPIATQGTPDARQPMRVLVREIREAGFRLVVQRLLDPISGESLHACTAVFRRTGEIWRVTARDASAAVVELARQVGSKIALQPVPVRRRPSKGKRLAASSTRNAADESLAYGVLTIVVGLTGYLASLLFRHVDEHLRDQSI